MPFDKRQYFGLIGSCRYDVYKVEKLKVEIWEP